MTFSLFGSRDEPNPRIKSPSPRRSGKDFRFTMFSGLSMLALASVGLAAGLALGADPGSGLVARGYMAVLMGALIYGLWPAWSSLVWALVVGMGVLFTAPGVGGTWAALAYELSPRAAPFLLSVLLALLLGPSVQIVVRWDKAVVLRLGRFHKVKGPGVVLLAPLVDRIEAMVDTRIRVTDFSAERILSRDTVPIHVDALAFWMVWDAQKAILEVEDFMEAVVLSAQTALRDCLGKYTLSTILAERDTLYHEIQTILDAKTNPWGITILSVEFVDIQLPKELEDSMSRQAQAEREKAARVYLADAELDVAKRFVQAAESYRGRPEALNLRGMSMVYDAMKERGSMVLLPSNALQGMNLGQTLGLAGYAQSQDTQTGLAGDNPGARAPDAGSGKEA